ncbi:MAG: acyltransferase [Roseburia sp.]|nr:acyltransferase [Roseburia sp.]
MKAENRKSNKNARMRYTAPAIVILLALCVVFYKSLDYEYTLQGDATDILENGISAASGCELTPKEGHYELTVNGEDPQFSITGLSQTAGGLALCPDGPYEGEPIAVQIFYVQAGEEFSERHSVKATLETGMTRCEAPLPLAQYAALRFDIDGDVSLGAIEAYSAETEIRPVISRNTVRRCMWYFPAVIVGGVLIAWAHGTRRRESGLTGRAYLGTVLFGAKPQADRAVHLDYLRVLAAVLVILAHACSPMVALADADWKRLLLVCGLSLGLCCNLLYVMLSGALLLDARSGREESVGSFYLRRASRVMIPLAAYYLLLLSLNDEVAFLPPRNIAASLKRIVAGAPDVGPHLWLIYTIVGLYLVTPFFRVMVRYLSDGMLFSLAVVIIALNALVTYLPLFGMSFGAGTFLAGWEGVFLLGYILVRQDRMDGGSRRNRRWMLAAAVSYGIMVTVVFRDSAQMNYVYNSTPTIVVASCGIFALFLNAKNWFADKKNLLVRLLSKYSYSIILIHWYALFVVVEGKFHITALRFGCIGGIGATVVLTLLVCLVMAVVFDNTVVIVCNLIFDRLVQKIQGIFARGRE